MPTDFFSLSFWFVQVAKLGTERTAKLIVYLEADAEMGAHSI
jgi:hypothetical protein